MGPVNYDKGFNYRGFVRMERINANDGRGDAAGKLRARLAWPWSRSIFKVGELVAAH